MSFLEGLWQADSGIRGGSTALVVIATAITTVASLSLLKSYLWRTHPKIIPSPLHTLLPRLSQSEIDKLEYKPDAFPGARDVVTPYGSIRVYEWGPEAGEKVLLIHGISTTVQTLTRIAHTLVNTHGCRVMLFDLFGRGFSDGVGDLPHDARLYTTQCLLALASSPLPWTGTSAFSLIGYSLGGGIAVHFAGAFPHLVSSLVLLAPAGLIRPETFGLATRFVFTAGLVPERLLAAITKRRLQQPIAASSSRRPIPTPVPVIDDAVAASLKEVPTPTNPEAEAEDSPPLEQRVLKYVHWMLHHHPGFIPAFMSSISHAPLIGQHDAWKRLADRPKGSTVVILARGDEIIDPEDYERDALPLLGGKERVEWVYVNGGHDFPMTHAEEVMGELRRAWELKG
ncbi:putative alpha/beta hydrolase family protein [Cercophora newfieldiana]|uniref:Alpha/beta hydrolase family protein n=1 Tax=Cercophora newfieldiana TaxID=92897 RepID=A0AA40D0Q7_9PEZI|nr:putative alpha/beta hydrolase family protein [Cercophora newfieldiana]